MFRKEAVLMVLGALALALTACTPTAAPTPATAKPPAAAPTKAAEPIKPPAPTSKLVALKYGTSPSAGVIPVYLAIDRGYFQEQGLAVETVDFNSATQALSVLATGQLDMMSFSPNVAALSAADRGVDLKVVADTAQSRPNWEWMWIGLRKDLADSGQVKKVSDLKGMKISYQSVGSLAEQAMQRMLDQGGLKPADAEIVVIPTDQQAAALANKAVAALFLFEPYLSRSMQEGLAVKWLPISSFFGGIHQAGLLYYGPTMIKDQDVGRRFMVGYLKGVRDYLKAMTTKEGRQQMADTLIKNTPLKDPKVYETMEWPYIDPNGLLDRKGLGEQYKWMVDQGLYKGKKSLDDLIDSSYAEYAAQKLGKQ